MRPLLGRRIRRGALAAACLAAAVAHVPSVQAGGWLVPLAQAAPAPKAGAPIPPSNVTAPGRMYIVEGIVVVLLFAGAVFAVCRSSQRT